MDTAVKADIPHLVYISLVQTDTSPNPLAPEHKQTEKYLKASGLTFTILRNNWYLENFTGDVQHAAQAGVLSAATGDARVGAVTRNDLAEAAARALTGTGHENKIYELSGTPVSMHDIARAVGEITGKNVSYKPVTGDQQKAVLAAGDLFSCLDYILFFLYFIFIIFIGSAP